MTTALSPVPALQALTSGGHAHGLVQELSRRLHTLVPEVLADEDPEDLHRLRVALRRLRTVLHQFGPALVLPRRLRDSRMALIARASGATRDLDVLQERLEASLLPRLPGREQDALVAARRRLRHRRRRAFGKLERALEAGACRKLLGALDAWQAAPAFTALGRQPLADWLLDWHRPLVAGLFLHPGWFAADSRDPDLHPLRKRIKAARYGLDHLDAALAPAASAWIDGLRQAQAILGDLHDLEVLEQLLLRADRRQPGLEHCAVLPVLLADDRAAAWRGWQDLAGRLLRQPARRALQNLEVFPACEP
jgi:CHAD domain-containing protein